MTDRAPSTSYSVNGSPQQLPGLSGTVWIQLFTADGKDITGNGHRHSVITDEDSTWTVGLHRFTYSDPAVYAKLDAIASSVAPEVIVVMYAGNTRVRVEKQWVTAVHDLPSRQQGSRQLRVETASLLWAMNRYPRAVSWSGDVANIVKTIAKSYGMEADCTTESAVQYQQARQTDFEFIKSRLATRAVVTDGETYGNFRLNVRYKPDGSGVLSFAPFKTANRVFNWYAIHLSDPQVKLHGSIEFVNKSAVAAASGAAGVRALVIDPYVTEYHTVESVPAGTATDTLPSSTAYSNKAGEQGDTSATQHLHTLSHTIDNDGYPDAQEQCTCARDAARMFNFEAVFTIASQPWLRAGDKITLVSGLKAPYDGDWYVFKAVTTVNEGSSNTHLTLVTDACNTQQGQSGTQVQSPDSSPNQALTARQPSVAPATTRETGNTLAVPVQDMTGVNSDPLGLPEQGNAADTSQPIILPPLPDASQ